GMVLAEDVYALVSIPAFNQSSMDGYAFSFNDWQTNKSLKIKGEMAAGNSESQRLLPGNAARIFTGAPVPAGADTVVMQEKTKIEDSCLIIADESIVKGLNVRLRGSEIKAGELALTKESLLMPPAIGFLASVGITEVLVYPGPSVSIIITGNELQTPGQPLLPGQVYESNSFLLQAALKQMNITEIKVHRTEDELEKVKHVIKESLLQSDVIFLTGGVSVGNYDFVVTAALENGVEKLFHKVKQRPGKPFFFGRKQSKFIFGFPGNPASALTCFYEYAEPGLKKLSKQKSGLLLMQVPLAETFKKSAGLTHFLKGFYNGKTVSVLNAQESYRLSSFANANCLIKIDEEITEVKKGEIIEIHLLPV
ncbi:MAG: gephyrin-like molybdotransferase Glp, partial [Chitinophagaceae bacterium]